MMKQCRACNDVKPIDDFAVAKEGRLGRKARCKECINADSRAQSSRNNEQHGEHASRLYRIWKGMKSRCTSQNATAYADYGGRGIKVCDEWAKFYSVFAEWARNNGYSEVLTLDRRDVDGHYSPENCRWVTRQQQMQNTRKREGTTSRFKGVSRCALGGKWQVHGSRDDKTVYIGRFDDEEDAARAYDAWALENFGEFANHNRLGAVA